MPHERGYWLRACCAGVICGAAVPFAAQPSGRGRYGASEAYRNVLPRDGTEACKAQGQKASQTRHNTAPHPRRAPDRGAPADARAGTGLPDCPTARGLSHSPARTVRASSPRPGSAPAPWLSFFLSSPAQARFRSLGFGSHLAAIFCLFLTALPVLSVANHYRRLHATTRRLVSPC